MTKAYLPDESTDSFTGLSEYTSFSFGFIPISSINTFNWFKYSVDEDLMQKIGLKSGSTFLNNISLFLNIFFLIFLHLMFLLFRKLISKKLENKPGIKKIVEAIYKLFTLCLYLRLLIEAYQFILICSTNEIYKFRYDSGGKIASLIIAFIVFILSIIFLIMVLIVTVMEVRGNSDKTKTLFSEFFNGTKDTKLSKFFTFMFIVRKAIIIIFMCFLTDLHILIKVAFFVLIQAIYLGYIVFIRPIEKAKDNIILALNETLMLLLSSMLFKYNTEPDWTSASQRVFFFSISCVGMIVALICVGRSFSISLLIYF